MLVAADPKVDMDDSIAALVRQDGWRAEGNAARVHYEGGGSRYAVEFYAGADAVLYWTVPETPDAEGGADGEREAAVPVQRTAVPSGLRERIRRDLAAADVDPTVEGREI
jgi:hypothetical protein